MISRDGCHNNQECRCKIVKQGRGSPVFSEEPHSLGDFVVGASATAHHNVPGGYGGIEERLCLSPIPSNLRTWGLRIFHNLRLSTLGVLPVLVGALSSLFRARAALQLENLALRHQIGVLQRSVKKRPKLTAADRLLWAWLCGIWSDWRSALVIVKPETVIAWHRKGFRLFWTWKIRHGQVGRPAVLKEVRDLIRKMSRENPLWGAPRIHGELLKLGIDIGQTSVGKYMVHHRKPPSQTWRRALANASVSPSNGG